MAIEAESFLAVSVELFLGHVVSQFSKSVLVNLTVHHVRFLCLVGLTLGLLASFAIAIAVELLLLLVRLSPILGTTLLRVGTRGRKTF